MYENDKFVGRVIVLHDVTSRKQAEVALKQQNERMALLYQVTAVTGKSLADQLHEVLILSTKGLGMELGIISRIEEAAYVVQHSYPVNEAV